MEMGGENVTYNFPPLLFGGTTLYLYDLIRRHGGGVELTRQNFEIKGICT